MIIKNSKIIKPSNLRYRKIHLAPIANGISRRDGGSLGHGRGNGSSSWYDGTSSGAGGGRQYLTDISDPTSLICLSFYSRKRVSLVDWDQIWDECNDEQKQHLLLFLPLRVTND